MNFLWFVIIHEGFDKIVIREITAWFKLHSDTVRIAEWLYKNKLKVNNSEYAARNPEWLQPILNWSPLHD